MEEGKGSAAAVRFVERYKELVEFTQKQVLPFHPPEFFPKRERPARWPKWRVVLDKIVFFPYMADMHGLGDFLIFVMWSLGMVGQCIFLLIGAEALSPTSRNSTAAGGSDMWLEVILTGAVLLGLLLAPFGYVQLFSFFFSKSIGAIKKIIWVAALICLNLFLFSRLPGSSGSTGETVPATAGIIVFLAFLFLFIVLPLLFNLTSMLIPIGIRVVWSMGFLVEYFYKLNKADIYRWAIEIATKPIEGRESAWKLEELPNGDIQALHDWAIENRDGTEKRILPTTIFLALLALVTSSNWFEAWITGWVQFFIVQLTAIFARGQGFTQFFLKFLPVEIAAVIIFIVIVFIIVTYFKMFRNLLVQTYVIEACTVAGYAAREREKEAAARAEAAKADAIPAGGVRGWLRRWLGM
jgi:hypothetical protein